MSTKEEVIDQLDHYESAGNGTVSAIYLTQEQVDLIRAALATDAPIVEGLDEAMSQYDIPLFHRVNPRMKPIFEAARLYAQGRTQSAMPEGWKLVPIEPTRDMHDAAYEEYQKPGGKTSLRQWKAMLSAAPPVTGGAWLPIETAPRDGTTFYGYSPTHGVRGGVFFHPVREDFDIGFSSLKRDWTHWCPEIIPAPPSSAEKEGV